MLRICSASISWLSRPRDHHFQKKGTGYIATNGVYWEQRLAIEINLLPLASNASCDWRDLCENTLEVWFVPKDQAIDEYVVIKSSYQSAYLLCSRLSQNSFPGAWRRAISSVPDWLSRGNWIWRSRCPPRNRVCLPPVPACENPAGLGYLGQYPFRRECWKVAAGFNSRRTPYRRPRHQSITG